MRDSPISAAVFAAGFLASAFVAGAVVSALVAGFLAPAFVASFVASALAAGFFAAALAAGFFVDFLSFICSWMALLIPLSWLCISLYVATEPSFFSGSFSIEVSKASDASFGSPGSFLGEGSSGATFGRASPKSLRSSTASAEGRTCSEPTTTATTAHVRSEHLKTPRIFRRCFCQDGSLEKKKE